MKILVMLSAVLAMSQGQLVAPGICRNETVVSNFDVAKYAGLWYEVYRYEQAFQLEAECVKALYTLKDGGVEVFNSHVTNGTAGSILGSAKPAPGASGSGKLAVNFPTVGPFVSDYWVLSTDYTDYSLVYSCRNAEGNTIKVSSWILSRRPRLSPRAVLDIDPVLKAVQGLAWEHYRETDNSESACKVIQ